MPPYFFCFLFYAFTAWWIQVSSILSVCISWSDSGKEKVRGSWVQHSIRVHRWRPKDLYQPAQHVPGRVHWDSFQSKSVVRCHIPSASKIEWLGRVLPMKYFWVGVAWAEFISTSIIKFWLPHQRNKHIIEVMWGHCTERAQREHY